MIATFLQLCNSGVLEPFSITFSKSIGNPIGRFTIYLLVGFLCMVGPLAMVTLCWFFLLVHMSLQLSHPWATTIVEALVDKDGNSLSMTRFLLFSHLTLTNTSLIGGSNFVLRIFSRTSSNSLFGLARKSYTISFANILL